MPDDVFKFRPRLCVVSVKHPSLKTNQTLLWKACPCKCSGVYEGSCVLIRVWLGQFSFLAAAIESCDLREGKASPGNVKILAVFTSFWMKVVRSKSRLSRILFHMILFVLHCKGCRGRANRHGRGCYALDTQKLSPGGFSSHRQSDKYNTRSFNIFCCTQSLI